MPTALLGSGGQFREPADVGPCGSHAIYTWCLVGVVLTSHLALSSTSIHWYDELQADNNKGLH